MEEAQAPSVKFAANPKPPIRALIVLCILVVLMWQASMWVLWWLAGDFVKAGQAGDTFGGINALFSGLAFVGVVYALLQQNQAAEQQAAGLALQLEALRIQQKDLNLQLDEMRASRDEMKKQAEAADRQVKATLKLQRAILMGSISTATMHHFHYLQAELEALGQQHPAAGTPNSPLKKCDSDQPLPAPRT